MHFCNHHHGGQLNITHYTLWYYTMCLVIQLLPPRFTLPQIFRLCCFCCVHSCREFLFGKGWIGRNTLRQSYLARCWEERAGVECPWRSQFMLTLEEKKRRYRISWTTFSATATNWDPPSTLPQSGPWGRIQSGSWQHLLAHEIGPRNWSIHCGLTRTIFHMIPF